MRKLLTAVLALVLLATPVWADHHEEGPATQGLLAIHLAAALDLADDDVDAATAVNLLTQNQIAPQGGWQADQPLTYGALDHVLNIVYGSYDTNFPDTQVPANAVGPIVRSEADETCGFAQYWNNRWAEEHNRRQSWDWRGW